MTTARNATGTLSLQEQTQNSSAPSPLLQVADYRQAWAVDLKAGGQLYMHNEPGRAPTFFSALGHQRWERACQSRVSAKHT